MEIISLDELRVIAGEKGFGLEILEKDYLVTYLLFLIKDIERMYFKGGTALNKIFLDHARLSEDLDFTVAANPRDIEKEIKEKVKGTIFKKITLDKNMDTFIRLVVHYRLYHEQGTIFIDLNGRDQLLLPAEEHEIKHFYPQHLPSYTVRTSHTYEMMADKMAAAIGRNRPRDHLDLYNIVRHNFLLDPRLVKKKCESSGDEFDITKMFNKAQKLKKRWDEDVEKFIRENVSFQEVMSTLAKHFNLKHEKASKKLLVSQKSPSDSQKGADHHRSETGGSQKCRAFLEHQNALHFDWMLAPSGLGSAPLEHEEIARQFPVQEGQSPSAQKERLAFLLVSQKCFWHFSGCQNFPPEPVAM